MRTISASALLSAWEHGLQCSPNRRAQCLIDELLPNQVSDSTGTQSLGERNAALLSLHRSLFGRELKGLARCPMCEKQLEFASETPDVTSWGGRTAFSQQRELEVGNRRIRYRLLNWTDLEAISGMEEASSARQALAARCVLKQSTLPGDGDSTVPEENVIVELSKRLEEEDPGASVEFLLECPFCGHRWQLDMDLPSFVMQEVDAIARRLLSEVHRLASAYGWSETDILSMSAARRRLYLEMVW